MHSDVVETIRKCRFFWNLENNVFKARILTTFGTVGKTENKDGKWCILTVFETIWNYREKT